MSIFTWRLGEMSKMFVEIVTGRNKISIYFLLIFMFLAPVAFFTNYPILNGIAWIMLMILGCFIFTTGIITRKEAKDSYNWPKEKAHSLRCSLNYTTNNNVKSYIIKSMVNRNNLLDRPEKDWKNDKGRASV